MLYTRQSAQNACPPKSLEGRGDHAYQLEATGREQIWPSLNPLRVVQSMPPSACNAARQQASRVTPLRMVKQKVSPVFLGFLVWRHADIFASLSWPRFLDRAKSGSMQIRHVFRQAIHTITTSTTPVTAQHFARFLSTSHSRNRMCKLACLKATPRSCVLLWSVLYINSCSAAPVVKRRQCAKDCGADRHPGQC